MTRPKAVRNVKAKATKKGIRITWKKVSGANGYYIYRSTKKKSGYKKIHVVKKGKTQSYLDKKARKGKTYYYKIPNAIAISKDDATAPARILAKYAKDVKALKLVAGVVEDAYYDEAGITALSSIPSREELLGKLLGSIQSPIANFARVISQIAEKQEEA